MCLFQKSGNVVVVYVCFSWIIVEYDYQFIVFDIRCVVVVVGIIGVGYGVRNLCGIV